MNILGYYQLEGGNIFNIENFLKANTPKVAHLFDIKTEKLKVLTLNGVEDQAVKIGTPSTPLLIGGEDIYPECDLVVFYNLRIITGAFRTTTKSPPLEFGILETAGFLWSMVAMAFRLYVITAKKLDAKELLPPYLFQRFKIDTTYEAALQTYVKEDWDANRMSRELDILFVSKYLSTCVIEQEKSGKPLDLTEFVSIVSDVRRSNWKSVLSK